MTPAQLAADRLFAATPDSKIHTHLRKSPEELRQRIERPTRTWKQNPRHNFNRKGSRL
jgi:hypothetical protein